MNAIDAATAIIKSKKYSDVCEDAIMRVCDEAFCRYPAKEAEKAARAKLHQITGAFMTPNQISAARQCLKDYAGSDASSLERALSYHSSTRERPAARELYKKALERVKSGGLILDLACGINPLVLGDMGYSVWACDISKGEVGLINDWSDLCGWNVRAEALDLITCDIPKGEAALFMKLLPVIERQRKNEAERLLKRVKARYKLVTFPTKTLSGRIVGMEKHYAEWFEPMLEAYGLIEKFVFDGELCYLLEDFDV